MSCSFGSRGRALYVGRLAQLVEHRLYTPAVTGSSPVPPTSRRSPLALRALAWGEPEKVVIGARGNWWAVSVDLFV